MNPVRADMVGYPTEYPWSSYHKNALEKPIAFITPHTLYQALGKTDKSRQQVYRTLFEDEVPALALEEIRNAINKAWVLGDNRFKIQIEKLTGLCVSLKPKGGDRESAKYRASMKNQLL